MATHAEPIFRRPSFFSNDCMSPTDYCNSLAFLPDKTSLDLDTLNHWRGKPGLHYGSTPDFDINFIDTKDPRGRENIYGAIGSGRPKPGSPVLSKARISGEGFPSTARNNPIANAELTRPPVSKPKIFGKDFPSTETLKLTSARLTRPKVSKFAKLFPSNEPHGEATTGNLGDERMHTINVSGTLSSNQVRRKRDITRSRYPKLEHRGDMSNLRPDDGGVDRATLSRLYGILTPEDHIPPITLDSEDSDASTSSEVTFALGVQDAPRFTAEQRAEFRVRAREHMNEEAATFRQAASSIIMTTLEEADEELSNLRHMLINTYISRGTEATGEEIIIAEGPERR